MSAKVANDDYDDDGDDDGDDDADYCYFNADLRVPVEYIDICKKIKENKTKKKMLANTPILYGV